MKKLILIVLLAFLVSVPSIALAKTSTKVKALNDSSGLALSSYSLVSGTTVYSEGISTEDNIGFSTLLVTEDIAGGAGDVDISVEYSVDGTNWYPAYTTDMAGTITIEGNIVTALQNVTRWIPFTVRLAPFMRFKFDPDANSQITATSIYQRDR